MGTLYEFEPHIGQLEAWKELVKLGWTNKVIHGKGFVACPDCSKL